MKGDSVDGNRGAKGSIKDRLISMLYRLRYLKKVKKEEEYEISKKEKQLEYLKKLVSLKETENIDILDSKDKNELDKIKFNANYVLRTPKYFFTKKGINDSKINEKEDLVLKEIDFNLENIEYKTDELNEKVELKKEIEKVEDEVVILKEVDIFIKKSKIILNEINDEVDYLKRNLKEEGSNTKELEERYNNLKKQIDILKKQYEAVKDKYDFSEFSILESIKLVEKIDDYKNKASVNEIDFMIRICKKEISKIDHVTIQYEKVKNVGNDIESVNKSQQKIKVKFHKNKENIEKIKQTEDDITNQLNIHEKTIGEMYNEAMAFEKIARTEFEYSGYGRMFSSLLKIAGGVLTLPFTGKNIFGVALGNTMINRGLKVLNNGLDIKKRIVYSYKYTDIAPKINEIKDKIEYTNLIINDNLNELHKLKNNLREYMKYKMILTGYDDMEEKIQKLEDKLKLQQDRICSMDRKLDEEKILNDKKLKKVMCIDEKK